RRCGCSARGRRPLRTIGLELELRAGVEGLRQVPGVFNYRNHEQPYRRTGIRRQPMDILRDGCILTIRHAVFPEVALPEICRHYLQRAAAADGLPARRGAHASPRASLA